MIILIIALFTVCTLISFFFIKHVKLRWLCGCLSVLFLTGSVVLLLGNFAWNWGTKEVITTTTRPVYTAGSTNAAYGILVKTEIGKASGNYAFTYRSSKNGKVDTHFVPDTSNIIAADKKSATYQMTSSSMASVKTVTTRRKFSSDLMSLLFKIGGGQNMLIKQKTTVNVPEKTWLVLTDAQAKELTAKGPQLEDAAKAQVAKEQAQVQAAIAAAPTPEMKLQIEEEAKSQVIAQQEIENNPIKYAEQQIALIKKVLNIK